MICDHSRTILSSLAYLRHPFSISVFGSTMYWSEWDTHAIYQVGDTSTSTSNIIISLYLTITITITIFTRRTSGLAAT